ncbi:MAG: MauE/DoxX family redox-associated membrane protein [Microthrixaceae bacterium]
MTILDGAFWAVSLVLVASGAAKLAEPTAFAEALDGLGIGGAGASTSVRRWTAVGVGLVELGIGLNALVLGGAVLAALAAAAYAAFTVVVLVARGRGLASCGCFGARSGTPTAAHAAINAASALICAAAVLVPPPPVSDGLRSLSTAVALVVVVAVLAAASAIVIADTR